MGDRFGVDELCMLQGLPEQYSFLNGRLCTIKEGLKLRVGLYGLTSIGYIIDIPTYPCAEGVEHGVPAPFLKKYNPDQIPGKWPSCFIPKDSTKNVASFNDEYDCFP